MIDFVTKIISLTLQVKKGCSGKRWGIAGNWWSQDTNPWLLVPSLLPALLRSCWVSSTKRKWHHLLCISLTIVFTLYVDREICVTVNTVIPLWSALLGKIIFEYRFLIVLSFTSMHELMFFFGSDLTFTKRCPGWIPCTFLPLQVSLHLCSSIPKRPLTDFWSSYWFVFKGKE